jgi:regulator of sirC expression with transglutaminase-like and TPR domain
MTEPDDETAVEHDPLAEEADLLTIREARARVTEELREVRRRLAALEDDPSATEDPAAVRARMEHLERAVARFDVG